MSFKATKNFKARKLYLVNCSESADFDYEVRLLCFALSFSFWRTFCFAVLRNVCWYFYKLVKETYLGSHKGIYSFWFDSKHSCCCVFCAMWDQFHQLLYQQHQNFIHDVWFYLNLLLINTWRINAHEFLILKKNSKTFERLKENSICLKMRRLPSNSDGNSNNILKYVFRILTGIIMYGIFLEFCFFIWWNNLRERNPTTTIGDYNQDHLNSTKIRPGMDWPRKCAQ